MNTMGVQFRNEQFLFWSRPHKGFRWGVRLYAAAGLFTSRRRNPAENAEQGKKGHLWMDISNNPPPE